MSFTAETEHQKAKTLAILAGYANELTSRDLAIIEPKDIEKEYGRYSLEQLDELLKDIQTCKELYKYGFDILSETMAGRFITVS